MMERAERAGLGVSVVGHGALLVILSLNLMSVREMPKLSEPMDVMLVDKVGLTAGAPEVSKEAPQSAEAPELGPIEEAAPPEPAPPAPTPPPPAPTPKPSPSPKVAQKPTPPAPAKPAPPRAAPPAAVPAKAKPKATSLGDDFLKGIPVAKSTGKAVAPRAALSPIAMNGLVALIASQVKPCYTIPTGGTDALSIVSKVRMRLKPDGSIAVAPEIVGNLGVTPANEPYRRQMNEAATRALQRCAPYKLPAELYEGGWEDLIFNFRPAQMN